MLETPTILVMKSTVPVGTGAEGAGRELDALDYSESATSPIPSSSRRERPSRTSRVPTASSMGSFAEEDGGAVAGLYEPIGAPIVAQTSPSAEMIKYASNAFLATKISFINEIANVCEETGADVTVVAAAMGLDHRLGPHFLRAGNRLRRELLPQGHSALKQLAGNSGYHFQLLTAVIEVNELQKRRVVGKLPSTSVAARERRSLCSASPSSRTRTTCARRRASCSPPACLPRGRHVRAWDPVAIEEARPLFPEWPSATT